MKFNKRYFSWILLGILLVLIGLTIGGYAFSEPDCVADCLGSNNDPAWVVENNCRINCWLTGN